MYNFFPKINHKVLIFSFTDMVLMFLSIFHHWKHVDLQDFPVTVHNSYVYEGSDRTCLCVPDSDGRVQRAAHHKHAVKLQNEKKNARFQHTRKPESY